MSKVGLLRADHPRGLAWSGFELLAKPSTHSPSCWDKSLLWPVDFGMALDQTHVSIRIEPAGLRGELRLRAALATPDWPHGKSNQHGVQVAIILSYSDLAAFQRDFTALLDGKLQEACLEAAPT
jgi:hypothetical protein